jgi:periplasmic copper chaperone A
MMHARAATALTGFIAIALAGCGAGDPKPGPEVAGGNAGVDERVSAEVKVLDVELEYPLDGAYEPGGSARLYLAISNTGENSDVLTEVRGPDFASAVDGTPADGLAIDVPGNDTVHVGAEDEPSITLVDLEQQLRSSESIPVTFRFEHAGAVTVQAVVAAEGQTPSATVDFPDPDEDPSGEG